MNFTTSLSANMGAFGIIATILAIIATVAAFSRRVSGRSWAASASSSTTP